MSTEQVENIGLETREVYTHVAMKMVQTTALVAPTVGLARAAYRRNFSVNRWLRANAIWTFGFGTTAGLAMAWARLRNEPDIAIYDRAYRIRSNVTQVRVDDYSKIGAVLGALLTTTIFLRRASILNNAFGGAALGVAGGTITHIVKMLQEEGAKKAAKQTAETLPKPTGVVEGASTDVGKQV